MCKWRVLVHMLCIEEFVIVDEDCISEPSLASSVQ